MGYRVVVSNSAYSMPLPVGFEARAARVAAGRPVGRMFNFQQEIGIYCAIVDTAYTR